MSDFVRQLPGGSFTKRTSIADYVHLDWYLLLLIYVTSAYGLVILFSAVDQKVPAVTSQAVKIAIASVGMVIMAQFSPIVFRRLAPWLYGLGLVLLIAVLVVGTEVNGSQRWLRVPGVASFQPSEFMKLILPMMLATYFHERHLPPKGKHIFWALVMIAIPVLLVARQPDLGTSLLIGAAGLLVLLLAGIPWRFVFGAPGLGMVCAPGLWFLLRDYQKNRILTLLDPERDPLGAGWNIIQSKTAIGSGGLFGKGLFEGTQSHLDFLPESQTDFIIAVLAEELGLIGVCLLLILYILLSGRSAMIAIQAQDTFSRLLAGSITFTFFVYVFVNIGMVSGILPVVGVPLPLVSFGGTSLLTLLASFGILMSIHTHRRITL